MVKLVMRILLGERLIMGCVYTGRGETTATMYRGNLACARGGVFVRDCGPLVNVPRYHVCNVHTRLSSLCLQPVAGCGMLTIMDDAMKSNIMERSTESIVLSCDLARRLFSDESPGSLIIKKVPRSIYERHNRGNNGSNESKASPRTDPS
jgi:hypothetical protein